MSKKLVFAKKQVIEQFFEQKNMSKKMSNHPSRFSQRFSSEKQATIHSGLYTTVFCEKIRT